MKTSIKISAILALLFGTALGSKAQTTTNSDAIKYSVGIESGISLGNFKNVYKTNIAGSLEADIPVANQFSVLVNAGYKEFIGKDDAYGKGISANNLHYLPVMAGLKYFPVSGFYLQGAAGAAFALNGKAVGYTNTTSFLYVPQVGIQIPVTRKSFIDAGLRYEGTTKFNSNRSDSQVSLIGLRIAYGFGI